MRRSFPTFVLLLAATALNAQALIKTNFQKDDQATYETVTDVKVSTPMSGGSESIKTNSKTKITIQNATTDGHIIEVLTTNMKMEGSKEVAQQTGNMLNQYLSNVPMLLKTDTNGKVEDLLSYIEVQTKAGRFAMTFIDSLYNASPEMEKVLPKYKMAMPMNSQFIREAFIESVEYNTFFRLFSKTLKTDDKEDKDIQGIKTAVTYELNKEPNALNIIGGIRGNMTEDGVKAFLINKMKQMGANGDMVSQLDASWGQIKQMDMANMGVDDTSITKFLDTGWATEYNTDVKTKVIGIGIFITSTTKLVEESWK